MVGKGMIDVAGAHRWMVHEKKRAAAMSENEKIAKMEDLRYNFVGVLRKLADMSEFTQKKYLAHLVNRERSGLLEAQLNAVIKEVEEAQQANSSQFGMTEADKALMAKISGSKIGTAVDSMPDGQMVQGDDGRWRRQESQEDTAAKQETAKKQVQMMQYMVEQQTLIA